MQSIISMKMFSENNSWDKCCGIRLADYNRIERSQHHDTIAKECRYILGHINSKVVFKTEKVIISLYVGLARPELKLCVQFKHCINHRHRKKNGEEHKENFGKVTFETPFEELIIFRGDWREIWEEYATKRMLISFSPWSNNN